MLAARRDLRVLLTAGVVSMTGDRMLGIGLAYYVYVLTGSTLASAGMLLALFVPSILLGSVAGVLVDRWDRKRTMIAANVLMACGLVPLVLVRDPSQIWIAYAATAWEGTIRLLFSPAEQAMVPRVVPDDELLVANALNGQVREVARLVGAAAGGVVVGTGGLGLLVALDAATFLVSALLIGRLRTSGAVTRHTTEMLDDEASSVGSRWARFAVSGRTLGREWGDGLRLAMARPQLRAVFLYTLIVMTGEGVMGTLFAPFVRDVLHGSSQAYGTLAAVQAIGGISGGVVAASLSRRASPVLMFGLGGMLFGFVDLVMFVYPVWLVAVWPAVVCMVVVGVPGAVAMAGYNTLLQRGSEDAFRGRVFGALGAVQGLAVLTGAVAAGFLGDLVGVQQVIVFQGLGSLIAGFLVLMLLRGSPEAVAPTRRQAPGTQPEPAIGAQVEPAVGGLPDPPEPKGPAR